MTVKEELQQKMYEQRESVVHFYNTSFNYTTSVSSDTTSKFAAYVTNFMRAAIDGVSYCSNPCKHWLEEIRYSIPETMGNDWKRELNYRIDMLGKAAEKYAVVVAKEKSLF